MWAHRGYQWVVDRAKQIVDHWKQRIDPNHWPEWIDDWAHWAEEWAQWAQWAERTENNRTILVEYHCILYIGTIYYFLSRDDWIFFSIWSIIRPIKRPDTCLVTRFGL